MKAQVKVTPGLILEIEAGKQKDLFKAMASAHEVFGEKECGICHSKDIRPVWRTVVVQKGKGKPDTFEYPEYHCFGRSQDGYRCGARLALGTLNDDAGTLFPKRRLLPSGKPPGKDDDASQATYGAHNGWNRYKGKPEEEVED